jgi:hypothetical protein
VFEVSVWLLVTALLLSEAVTVVLLPVRRLVRPATEATPVLVTLTRLVLLEVQVTKLLMIVPSCARAVNCAVAPAEILNVTVEGDTVIEVIVVVVTRKVGVAVWPPSLTVTNALPAPTVFIKQEVLVSTVMTAVLELVHFAELVTSPPELPLTSVAVTVNCCVPPGVSNVETGLTLMLPTEVGETKKPLQPVNASAMENKLRRARTATAFLDIAPPKTRLHLIETRQF